MTACPPGYSASLRVYEPLAAFDDEERRQWEAVVASGGALPRGAAPVVEREAGLSALLPVPRVPDSATDDGTALVLRAEGGTLVCPLRTAVRSWQALADFRSGLPEELAEAFVPAAVTDEAVLRLEAWRRERPDGRVHVQIATWQVPLRWFVLVAAEERRLVLGRRARGEERSLLYRTPMTRARRRLVRALSALRGAGDYESVVLDLEELGRWLAEFHPRAVVELDYGGLVGLLDDEALRSDESARDVSEALASLAEGDVAAAVDAYERVVSRWRKVAALEVAN